MTTFDHLTAGTPEQAWDLTTVAAVTFPPPGSLVVVIAAHPDDETLGAGGLIAACARRGLKVRVVVATDGEASHPHSVTHTPAVLAARRRVEVQAAIGVLAPGVRVQFLGLPDGGLADCLPALTDALTAAGAGATHLVSPWTGDRHPDHEACARATAASAAGSTARHWQYPIWAWHWADPTSDDLPRHRLRAVVLESADVAAKTRAIECHESQHAALSRAKGDEAILPEAVLAHFRRPLECFVTGDDDASRPGYFDEHYEADDDPWGLSGRFYEQRKRQVLLAALPQPRFRRAFEPGCATGLLTQALAERCDQVVAWDVAGSAVSQTRARIAGMPVTVARGAIPEQWPDGSFDLVVLSEVGYYCRDLTRLRTQVLSGLDEHGVLVACHWRHPAPDHPQSAQDVHDVLGAELQLIVSHVEADFLLHVWSRSGRSVAVAEGIAS